MNGRERMNSRLNEMNHGSDRTKHGPTPKQNKWKDP